MAMFPNIEPASWDEPDDTEPHICGCRSRNCSDCNPDL